MTDRDPLLPEVERMIEEVKDWFFAKTFEGDQWDEYEAAKRLRDLVRQALATQAAVDIKAHHKQPWHECPDCTRWFQQDENGAVENAKLSAALATVTGELRDKQEEADGLRGVIAGKERIIDSRRERVRALEEARKAAMAVVIRNPLRAWTILSDAAPASPASSEGAAAPTQSLFNCRVCRKEFDEVGRRRTCRECRAVSPHAGAAAGNTEGRSQLSPTPALAPQDRNPTGGNPGKGNDSIAPGAAAGKEKSGE